MVSHLSIEGVIRFIGETHFNPKHVLYGLELKKPKGTHNGTVDDRTYFQCPSPNSLCGIFVNSSQMTLKSKKKKKIKSTKRGKPKKSKNGTSITLKRSVSENALAEPPRARPITRYQIETNRKRCSLLTRAYCHILQDNLSSDKWTKSQCKSQIPTIMELICNQYLLQNVTVNDFERIRDLGKGGFATVKLVKYIQNGDGDQQFAMKSVSKKLIAKKKMAKQLFTERDALLHLNHPLIVQLFWTFHDETYFYFVQEFCSGGDLMELLIERDTLNEKMTKQYISELAVAVDVVHGAGYVHRDIKPENILLTRSGGADGICHIKLCDFGSAARLKPGKLLYELQGTPDYVSPEMLERKGYGMECDWWALGIILFQCLCGYTPFGETSPKQTCMNIVNHSRTLMIATHTALRRNARDCIRQLVCSRESRMGFDEIKKHSFFVGVDWDGIK